MIRLDLCPSCRRGHHASHTESREAGTVVCPCTGGCKDLGASIEMEDRALAPSALDLSE